MMLFYVLAGALCLLAVAFLTRPAWWPRLARRRSPAAGVRELAGQLAQLKALHASGTLSDAQFAESSATVERKVLEALEATGTEGVPAAPSPRLALVLAVFMCALSAAGYRWIGAPGHLDLGPGSADRSAAALAAPDAGGGPEGQGDAAAHPVTPEQVSAMVDRLAQRLKERPDDAEGWQMLARSYVVLGKHADSIAAFRQAVRLAPANPDLLADFADALAMANGRSLAGEPSALVERALKIDANNPKALALAGTAAFDRHDYKGAVAAWETLAKLPGADASFVQQLQGSIAEARQLAGMPAATVSLLDPGASANDAGRAAQSVSGTVTLAPSLAGQVSPADTVFVFARAASGGRMPLGILRKKVSDLPLRFTLDDSMAMSPDAKLSSAARVVVGARVSKSGNAMPQGGDLQGLTDPVPVGSSDLRIEIDQAVAR